MKNIWSKVKAQLKKTIPGHCFRMWIEPLEFKAFKGDTLTLSCPNEFSKKRILGQYLNHIEKIISSVTEEECKLRFVISKKNGKVNDFDQIRRQLDLPKINDKQNSGRFLQKDYTFDQFVVGGNNDFAYSAALSLAVHKKRQLNSSLLLLSNTGLGKSHLSQAIGHHILSESPSQRVFYITAEDFTNEMVDSFKNNSLGIFKDKYRYECDVLLLEDIHYLAGKYRTQVELASTIDTLYNAGKKLIFSSCYGLNEIPKLNEQLKSRISSGVVSQIEPPEYNTRVRILKKKAKMNNYQIPDDVLHYLAGELTEDVRQLQSGLIGVTTKSSLLGIPINIKLAESVVRNIIRNLKCITINSIKKVVSKHYNVTVKDLMSKSRKQSIVRPRQVAMYLSRKYTDQPLQVIGKSFNRYHATALYAIGSVEKGIKESSALQKQVEFLSNKLETGKI